MELAGIAKAFYDDGKDEARRQIAEQMPKQGLNNAFIAEMVNMPIGVVEDIARSLAAESASAQ